MKFDANIIGQKFGKLTVLYKDTNKYQDRCTRLICICECGKEKSVLRVNLKNGNTTSCGCHAKLESHKRSWKGTGEISKSYWGDFCRNADLRNIEFSITSEYAWELYLKQNRKCAISGIEITFAKSMKDREHQTASLDRIDNTKGYIEGNVQWVHKKINRLKNDFTMDELLFWCEKIHLNKKVEYKRLNWDEYFLSIAKVISKRSHDIETQHGCVIVDETHKILGMGFNGFPHGMRDNELPNKRPEKYDFMIHAELNAIHNCILPPKNAIAYVTGECCNNCIMQLWQAGIIKIIHLDTYGSKLINEETRKIRDIFVSHTGMEIVKYAVGINY